MVDAKADAPEKPTVDAIPAERMAILTPGGPLLVDVRITLDGEPLTVAWQKVVDAAAARDETTASDDEEYGEEDRKPSRPLALRSSRAYVPDPRASSRVWPLFDADADGRLSAVEIDNAAERLWSRDANDDRVIALSELASLRDQLDGAANGAMPAPSNSGPASARLAALQLDDKTNMERVDFMLQDLYAPLQDLTADSFTDLPDLFGQLDASGDAWVERDELSQLATIKPALELAVTFQDGDATVTIAERADELKVVESDAHDRVVLALGKTRLVISAHDLAAPGIVAPGPVAAPAGGSPPNPLEQAQVRLMVHDRGDALFAALDANADGRLGEREIASAPASLRKRDADADGDVADSEAPYAMIVAFLWHEPAGAPRFSVPPAAPPKGEQAPPPDWFAHADLNHDGDVSPREFLGSAEQFAALDANGDGFLAPAELTGAGSAARN